MENETWKMKMACFSYSRLPVIRTYTYSNNSVIRTEIAFPLDLLTQLRQKHSRLFKLQLFEFQLFEPIFIPLGANYRLNQPQLFEFLLLGYRRVRTLIFCDENTFLFKKSGINIHAYFTLFNLFVCF